MKHLRISINIFVIAILILYSKAKAQNYFPLEIGNRWDYEGYYYAHSDPNNISYYTQTVEIVSKTKLANGKEYFVLSNDFQFGSNYLRMNDDSLFCFSVQDSTDCLLFSFNQVEDSTYQTCKYGTMLFAYKANDNTFGKPDTEQVHAMTLAPGIQFHFSEKFGLLSYGYSNLLVERWYTLDGCIISGTTYGTLLGINNNQKSLLTFHLEQNYPNPFNPTTIIKYSIPKQSYVTLKVYDVLGREIRTLVNKNEMSGNYSVNFSASNLSSGIYFYQIKAGDYVQTRKMILLK